VTDTNDALLTAITNGSVLELAAREAARHDQILQAEVAVRAEREGVSRVVTMLVPQKAAETQVIVLAVTAMDQVGFINFCTTVLAKPSRTSKNRGNTYHGSTRCKWDNLLPRQPYPSVSFRWQGHSLPFRRQSQEWAPAHAAPGLGRA